MYNSQENMAPTTSSFSRSHAELTTGTFFPVLSSLSYFPVRPSFWSYLQAALPPSVPTFLTVLFHLLFSPMSFLSIPKYITVIPVLPASRSHLQPVLPPSVPVFLTVLPVPPSSQSYLLPIRLSSWSNLSSHLPGPTLPYPIYFHS